jgi:hypothetical protein
MRRNYLLQAAVLSLALATIPAALDAQTASIVGTAANFDAVNTTGGMTYGFEIEADGIQVSDIYRIFGGLAPNCMIRYCTGTAVPFPGGVYIRWMSRVDPATNQFLDATPLPNGTFSGGESCWTGGLGSNYAAAGCEHFGISTTRPPTNTVYRWLVADPANPGQLTYYTNPATPGAPAPPVFIPSPIVNIIPPAQAGAQPAVDFAVQLPTPAPAPRVVPQWGEAKWVKILENEIVNEVDVNDLLAGNVVVPLDDAQVETPWKLLQTNPNSPNSGSLHSRRTLGNGKHAVVRRYEFYDYTGHYDPSTHEALCAGAGDCATPQLGELGPLSGVQMAAANVQIPSVTVTKVGSGTVTGANGKINCGGNCSVQELAGTQVTLTASAPGSGVFGGWSGACTNPDPTCSLVVNTDLNVTATFNPVFTLSIGRGGNGSIVAAQAGSFGTFINCPGSCSAKYPAGAAVTLAATPQPGHTFVNWTGACSGTATSCTLVISKDTTAQANFK